MPKIQYDAIGNALMEIAKQSKEIAGAVGLKGPRTRQLLNELVAMGVVECTAATKNRRYIKK